MAIRKLMTIKGHPARPSRRFEPATDWDRETNLTKGRHKISHRGLINSQENDQQRQSSITYRVCWRLVYQGPAYYNTLPRTKNAIHTVGRTQTLPETNNALRKCHCCGGLFFLLFKNFDSMQRNSKTRFYHSAETSAIESSSKSGLEKVFKSFKF